LVDDRSSFDGSDGFSKIGDIPDVEGLVSSSSGKIFTVRGDSNSVNRSVMGFESRSNLEVDVPDLKSSIPTNRGKVGFEGNLGLGFDQGRVSNTRDPFSVVVRFTGEFTVSEGVP
jgi:hypothetical protein